MYKKLRCQQILFLQTPSLKTLHLSDYTRRTRIREEDIGEIDRLPPLEELKLKYYHWRHTPRTAIKFWNWSQLLRLELHKVEMIPFLRTVPPEHLKHLQEFTTDGWRQSRTHSRETTRLLCELIIHIDALQKLVLPCDVGEQTCIDAIRKHGPSLRTLGLLNYNVARGRVVQTDLRREKADDEDSECLMSVAQLARIGLAYLKLTDLTIRYFPRRNKVCIYSPITHQVDFPC